MSYSINVSIDIVYVERVEELKRKGELSGLVNKLLKDYFDIKIAEETKASEMLITIRTEQDIDNYINGLILEQPTASKYGLKILKENLLEELKIGEFLIDVNSGKRSKVFKKED